MWHNSPKGAALSGRSTKWKWGVIDPDGQSSLAGQLRKAGIESVRPRATASAANTALNGSSSIHHAGTDAQGQSNHALDQNYAPNKVAASYWASSSYSYISLTARRFAVMAIVLVPLLLLAVIISSTASEQSAGNRHYFPIVFGAIIKRKSTPQLATSSTFHSGRDKRCSLAR